MTPKKIFAKTLKISNTNNPNYFKILFQDYKKMDLEKFIKNAEGQL